MLLGFLPVQDRRSMLHPNTQRATAKVLDWQAMSCLTPYADKTVFSLTNQMDTNELLANSDAINALKKISSQPVHPAAV